MMNNEVTIISCYHFSKLENLEQVVETIQSHGDSLGVLGLIIFAEEGFNMTIAGEGDTPNQLIEFICSELSIKVPPLKVSYADEQPFKAFKVQVRDETITSGTPNLIPDGKLRNHLSPQEWHELLTSDEDIVVLDTRNEYETKLGMFKGAIDPNLDVFSEFPEYIKKANFPKDKKILMYCTGGIRCEKAILQMHQEGYDNVYQLDGGILNYLEQYPEGTFEGDCFVFDGRIAVDGQLQASQKYHFCPHCGDPATEKLECPHCSNIGAVCIECVEKGKLTCCKNCEYHYQRLNQSAA